MPEEEWYGRHWFNEVLPANIADYAASKGSRLTPEEAFTLMRENMTWVNFFARCRAAPATCARALVDRRILGVKETGRPWSNFTKWWYPHLTENLLEAVTEFTDDLVKEEDIAAFISEFAEEVLIRYEEGRSPRFVARAILLPRWKSAFGFYRRERASQPKAELMDVLRRAGAQPIPRTRLVRDVPEDEGAHPNGQ